MTTIKQYTHPIPSEHRSWLESMGFDLATIYTTEDIWARDVPAGYQQLHHYGNRWWATMLQDRGDYFDDEWISVEFADPISAYTYAEVECWGVSSQSINSRGVRRRLKKTFAG